MKKRIREGFPGQRLIVMPRDVVRRSSQLPVVRDLYVTDIGHFPNTRYHYVSRPRGARNYILIYCVGGAGWYRKRGKRWPVEQGKALLIPPEEPHVYAADDANPWMIYWVHFNGLRAADYAEYLQTPTDRPVLFVPHPAALIEAFERAYHWLEHGFSDASLLALSSGLAEILSLANMYRRAESTRARDAEERVIRSISFMRENLDRPHYLKELAGTAHLSVPHYSSLFKRYTGASPVQFLIRLRIQKACELLDNTQRPIQEIGNRVGYEDPFYFSRLFTKVTGTSPSRYRRTVKG